MRAEKRMRIILVVITLFIPLPPIYALAQGRIWDDASGRKVVVPLNPRRIVSLAPSITENLFALGRGDNVVGVTDYCDFPPEALKKEKVGGGLNPSLEKIVSLKPDLVLGLLGVSSLRVVSSSERLGLPVYFLDSRGFHGVLKTLEELGRLTGTEEKATELVNQIKARAQAVRELTKDRKRPRVLFLVWQEPLWTVGKDSFLNDLVEMAGGASVTGDMKGETAILSPEAVIARAPEVILVSLASGVNQRQQTLMSLARFNSVPAVKKGKVFVLDSAQLNRASYRVAQGAEELARIFHPELFAGYRK